MRGRAWGDWPERSTPRPVSGGVRAKSGRGAFAKNWWGQAFLAALAALDPYEGASRLGRGRSYARKGQVLNVEIAGGVIDSKVQGSRARPYTVRIQLTPLPDPVWRAAAGRLGEQGADLAALLAGSLTPAAEEAFKGAGASLFPATEKDLTTRCSCPDWANPCKHVAAVYYLVAEELDRDPLLLLTLRGVAREAFIAAAVDAAEPSAGTAGAAVAPGEGGAADRVGETLPTDDAAFWGAPTPAPTVTAVASALDAPLVRGLGEVAFWRGEQALASVCADVLRGAAALAVALLVDDAPPGQPGPDGREGAQATGAAKRPAGRRGPPRSARSARS